MVRRAEGMGSGVLGVRVDSGWFNPKYDICPPKFAKIFGD
jgi:hypothetical protein